MAKDATNAPTNAARGADAETTACAVLVQDGFSILGRRLRTPLGEIDIVAVADDLLVFVEVKLRPNLADAAAALGARQQSRLSGAAEYLLAEHPDWARHAMRFDVIAIDGAGRVRRIRDAFRASV